MFDKLEMLKGNLIVSCQALEDEPLHSSYIMGKMALAAGIGGACGIRANGKNDIEEIKKNVNLPIIGIIKKIYTDSKVYITPTMKEFEELISINPEIIALDATKNLRPNNKTLEHFFNEIKEKYPNQKLMADCSTIDEAIYADGLGFDYIATTLVGYTEHSETLKIEENDFEIIKEIIKNVKAKVIAEGNINTPEKAKRVIDLGCFSVVVGSSITRPQLITETFTKAIKS